MSYSEQNSEYEHSTRTHSIGELDYGQVRDYSNKDAATIGNITLKPGDKVLELGFHPERGPKFTVAKIRQSLIELAKKILSMDNKPKYLIFYSYGEMGKIAERFGAQVEVLNDPDPVLKKIIEDYYRQTSRAKKYPEQNPTIVAGAMDTEDFLKNFEQELKN